MNRTTQAILARLELLWEAADQDAKDILAEQDFDPDHANQLINRQETIADVIEVIKGMETFRG